MFLRVHNAFCLTGRKVPFRLAQHLLIDFSAWKTILKDGQSILGPEKLCGLDGGLRIAGLQRLLPHISFPFHEHTRLHDTYGSGASWQPPSHVTSVTVVIPTVPIAGGGYPTVSAG